jgi:hypothetical protein
MIVASRSDGISPMSDRVNLARATIALLWRGDPAAAQAPAANNNRLYPLFEAFAALGGEAVPVVYSDRIVGQVRDQLLLCDGVMVWWIRSQTAMIARSSTRCCARSPRTESGSARIPM